MLSHQQLGTGLAQQQPLHLSYAGQAVPHESFAVSSRAADNFPPNTAPTLLNQSEKEVSYQPLSGSVQPTRGQPAPVVAQATFSIPMLERKMMFLNEPALQGATGRGVDQIKQAWKLHSEQIQHMKLQDASFGQPEDVVPKKPNLMEDVTGLAGFIVPSGQPPKDFHKFQRYVKTQLRELQRAHLDLRTRFADSGKQVESDIERVQHLTEHLQGVFNDFVQCFNAFQQRESRLETLHGQAVRKSKELSQKMQLEVMAQSSQRSQLLAIVDDLTNQLKNTKASTVDASLLKKEQQAHEVTRLLLNEKEALSGKQQTEIGELKATLQRLGKAGANHSHVLGEKETVLSSMRALVADREQEIDDLRQQRFALEQQVSRLKSQLDLTMSGKDKIILKLKEEMRFQAHMSTTLQPLQQQNVSQLRESTLQNSMLQASKFQSLQKQMDQRASGFNSSGQQQQLQQQLQLSRQSPNQFQQD